MKWNEVTVATASEAVEAVANILMEHGASGVAIEDVLDIENFKSDAYGEILDKETYTTLEEGAQVSAYFPETIFYQKCCRRSKQPSTVCQSMVWRSAKHHHNERGRGRSMGDGLENITIQSVSPAI